VKDERNVRLPSFGGAALGASAQFMTRIAVALLMLLGSLAGAPQAKADGPVVEISIDNFTFRLPRSLLRLARW